MTQKISRHYLTIGTRRVHYRKCGSGPPVLMVHQSPRSSAEYVALMQEWGDHFTCVAPDTPGFGQSTPLAKTDPDINDYADAIAEFAQALNLGPLAAYGFHSGAIILITALKRHPHLFRAIAAGGYAVWTAEETKAFGERYTPPFLPMAYGEHLAWAWNRVLEQSWFFPWYDPRAETRLSIAHDDPAKVDEIIREILDAGDFFRLGYAAVLKAPRDIPPPDSLTPPVLISAYDSDPLQVHIDRLGEMPANWDAKKVRTADDQKALNLSFLKLHAVTTDATLPEDQDRGFVPVSVEGFDGLIHWHGHQASGRLHVHAPGGEGDLLAGKEAICIDLPGHGLSSGWENEAPSIWAQWQAVIDAVASHFGASEISFETLLKGDPNQLYPDLTPDRFGVYLTKAWQIVRARHFFSPWFEPSTANAVDFDPAEIAPEKLSLEHRALIRAKAAKALHLAMLDR